MALHGWFSCGLLIALLTAIRLAAISVWPFDIYADEAQYWLWGQSPDWGYFSKPPMIGWVAALTAQLPFTPITSIKFASPIAYAIASLCIYGCLLQLANARLAWWGAALFITLPGVHFSSHLYSTDPLLLMVAAAFFWAFFTALYRQRLSAWLLTGFLAGGLMLTKYNAILLLPACIMAYRQRHDSRSLFASPKHWLALLVACLCWLPNLLWNKKHGWVSWLHTHENANLSNWHFSLTDGLDFIGTQWSIAGVVALPWFIVTLKQLRHKDTALLHMMGWSMVPIIMLAFGSHAHGNWGALAFVPFCLWLGLHAYQKAWAGWMLGLNLISCMALSSALMQPELLYDAPRPIAKSVERVTGHQLLAEKLAPEANLLTNHRRTAAYIQFYLPTATHRYNPWSHDNENYFAIEHALQNADIGHNFFYVSPHPLPESLAARFRSVLDETFLTITLPTGSTRAYHTARLQHYLPTP